MYYHANRLRDASLQRALLAQPLNPLVVLEAVGELADSEREQLSLGSEWLTAGDGSAEHGCALALSGLGRGVKESRLNLKEHREQLAGATLPHRMLNLVYYRVRAAHHVSKRRRSGKPRDNAPFRSSHATSLPHIEAFLHGRLDEARMERLLRALILVQTGNQDSPRHKPALLPLPYVLAKLAFHQFGGDRRPAPIAVAEALATGQADLAVPLAARFLQARHESFPQVWPACPPLTAERGLRWAAALLFPISDTSYQALLEELL